MKNVFVNFILLLLVCWIMKLTAYIVILDPVLALVISLG